MTDSDQIRPIREKIREIDDGIITLLEGRLALVGAMWKIKKANGIDYRDKRAERALIEELKNKTRLDPKIIEVLYQHIFEENDRIYGK